MKGNQNLPNRQVTSNIMTGKPLTFSYRSRSDSRENRNNSRHRSSLHISFHKTTQNHILVTVTLNHPVDTVPYTQNRT